jgi:glycosyltransferase involved in cell wall biosynthesis
MIEAHRRQSILFVDNRTEYFISHRFPLALAAQRSGYDVHVTTLTSGDAAPIRAAGFSYHDIAPGKRDGSARKELILLKRLLALYQGLQPDLLHHITLRAVAYGGLAGLTLKGTPGINSITGLGYLFTASNPVTWVARKVLGAIFRVVLNRRRYRTTFQNVEDRRAFETSGWIRPGRAVVIPGSGVDPEHFKPLPPREGAPMVLFASRLLAHKGVREFVDAARILRDFGLAARFVIVGDSDPDNPAAIPMTRIEEWVGTGVVEYWGYRSDLRQVFAECAIVCLPSYREGVPKVLLEAAACGRAIVTTDVPGCRTAVARGENGLLVPARDSETLAVALRMLIEDRALRERMGAKGRERVEREFTVDRIVGATLALYEECLRRQGTARGELRTHEGRA